MINQAPTPRIRPVVNFDWTPKSAPITYTIGGQTYPYSTQADSIARPSDSRYTAYSTPSNQLLTFTSTVTVDPRAFVARYHWDFGDGTEGFGPTINHQYNVANPTIVVALTVTDSFGVSVTRTQPLNLVVAAPTVVKPAIRA